MLPQRVPMYIPSNAASKRGNWIKSTTYEDALVKPIRLCWNDHWYRRGMSINESKDFSVLKGHIRRLRTYRKNREINPKLHAKLDKECIEKYQEAWAVSSPAEKAAWKIFCRNAALLTESVWADSTRYTGQVEISGEQVTLFGETESESTTNERPARMPKEKVKPEYIQYCISEIEKGRFPEYMPVRETAKHFSGTAQRNFLHTIIRLAKADGAKKEATGSFNQERVIRVATNMLRELNNSNQSELSF